MKVEVSVVMPVYNALRASQHYLPQAIESVLRQTVADFELIIVDDGSDEDYGPLRKRYADDRLIWFCLPENCGQSMARNIGVERARGRIIAFIDQDDLWYPERLEYGLSWKESVAMTYSDIDEIDAAGNIVMPRALSRHQPGRHPIKSLADLLAQDSLVLMGTCLIRKETFLRTGGFDPALSGYEDDDFFLRVFQTGPVGFIEKPLLQYRVYEESYRSSERMDKSRSNYFDKLVHKFRHDGQEGPDLVTGSIAPRFSGLWLTRMRNALKHGEREIYLNASKELWRTSRYGHLRLRGGGALLSRIPFETARILYKMPRFVYLARHLFVINARPRR